MGASAQKQPAKQSKSPLRPSGVKKMGVKQTLPAIEGTYKAIVVPGDESQPCKLTVVIYKKNNKYRYILTTPGKVRRGAVTLFKSDDPKQFTCMITLEGIQWASYEGDISKVDDEHPAKEYELPVDITMGFINNELAFQNDGNAMNSYTVLAECDQKFVHLVKQK
ncbi:hypothetical protein GCM10011425_08720 [Mucilaginibacter galii]|uniref:Uncharacterized protein n=2 Tax=Mucilaginibacter galii TaxID=2005073 RepID=A0A917J5P9_9SPHI|nr:hypothetical protein GCM10011425_08720 [Mucilaginibacter galii]